MPGPSGPLGYGLPAQAFDQMSTFWTDVIHLEQVSSTNDVVKDLAAQGAPTGTVVVAHHQTAGRGRMNRRWVAPPGTSLLCSILFRPDLRPEQAHRLTMLCSMAAADAVEGVAGLSVALKWPNDLVVRSRIYGSEEHSGSTSPEWRKLAGVLTEARLSRAGADGGPRPLAFVVVGIGINVNVPRETLADLAPNATSILAETGRRVSRSVLLTALLEAVEARYERLRSGENPREEWSERLATLGRWVEVTTAEGTLRGTAEAVDEDGALLLRTEDGSLRRLLAGDVTMTRG